MEAGAPQAPGEGIPEAVPPEAPVGQDVQEDVQRLHEMGYKQELSRGWAAFTNFAISFTIISVLAGTFTSFLYAWQNGGPIAVSIGWPVLCAFVLRVAFSMAELTSRYPTASRRSSMSSTSVTRLLFTMTPIASIPVSLPLPVTKSAGENVASL